MKWVLVGLVAVLVVIGVALFALNFSDEGGEPDTLTTKANVQQGDGLPPVTLTAPEEAVDEAREDFTHKDLEDRPESAPPPSDAALLRAAEVQTHVKALPTAGAVQGFSGCQTRILSTNYSSRNGARATWQVLHYTVSHNVFGFADMNAIFFLFNNPGRQASSNFVIDTEGHCYYLVPIESKAWTQAGGNPWSVSYEIIAFGNEAEYLKPPGMAKLKSIMEQVAKRTGIPLRRGATSGSCTPVRSGIIQHKDFGLCGGGHVDITPFNVDTIIRQLDFGKRQLLTDKERKLVLAARHPKGTGHSRAYWRRRIAGQIFWLNKAEKQPRRAARLRILKRVYS